MRWIKHDLKQREAFLGNLLQHVRLPLTARQFLLSNVSDEPLIQGNQHGKDLLIEAMKYHLSPEHRRLMSTIRTQQRKPDGLRTYLFTIGGGSLFAIHSDSEFYNPRTDRWSPIAPTLERRSRHGVVPVNRHIYAVGMYQKAIWPFHDCNQQPISFNQLHIYVGGYNGSKDLSSGEYYDPLTNVWSAINNMGTKRSCLGIATLNGLIFCSGGKVCIIHVTCITISIYACMHNCYITFLLTTCLLTFGHQFKRLRRGVLFEQCRALRSSRCYMVVSGGYGNETKILSSSRSGRVIVCCW